MTATTKLVTAEELERMPEDERYELIRGELHRMSPAGRPHGGMLLELSTPLSLHVKRYGLGKLYAGEVGVILERDPDTVLAPDLAFVRADRLVPDDPGDGYMPYPPDLVVEIASPSDSRPALRRKAARYFAAGVPYVWLVEASPRTVSQLGADGSERVWRDAEILDGDDVLPGFRLPVADIFA